MSSNWSKFNLAKHYQMIVLPEGTGERCRGIYNQYLSSCCHGWSSCAVISDLPCVLGLCTAPGRGDSQALLRGQARRRGEVSVDTGKISAWKELSSPGAAAQAKAEALFLLKMK